MSCMKQTSMKWWLQGLLQGNTRSKQHMATAVSPCMAWLFGLDEAPTGQHLITYI